MILAAKNKNGNLERKLYELNEQARHFLYHDAERLYQLLTTLADEIDIGSKFLEGEENRERDILYIEKGNIEEKIKPNQDEDTPIIGYIQTDKIEDIVTLINSSSPFSVSVTQWDKDSGEAVLSIGMS